MTNRAPLHREAVAAMWLFGEQYAQSRGALDLWRELPQHQRDACREFVETVIAASPTTTGHRTHPESARKPVTKKSRERMRRMVAQIRDYWAKYDQQAEFETYSDQTFVDDALYAIGIALDPTGHQYAGGFDRFKAYLRDHLEPARIARDERTT